MEENNFTKNYYIFFKKVNNNTLVHIIYVLTKDLLFYRGVMRGDFTRNYRIYLFKIYIYCIQKNEKKMK